MANTNPNIVLNTPGSIWCMSKLTKIIYNYKILNLVDIGFGYSKIIIINLLSKEVHQTIITKDTVYSLAQFKNDSNYLICCLSNGETIIYILKGNKYERASSNFRKTRGA